MSHQARIRTVHLLAVLLMFLVPSATHAISGSDNTAITDNTPFYDPDFSCSPTTGPLNGDNNAIRAYNFFITKGLSPTQASGIVGNMIEESGVGPERLQYTPASQVTTAQTMVSTGQYQAAGIGWGIVQWTPADQAGNGVIITNAHPSAAVNTLSYQLDALWTEINGPKRNVITAIKATKTVPDAVSVWLNDFEIGSPNPFREIAAQAMYELTVNHTPLPASVLNSIVPESAANPGGLGNSGSPCGSTPSGPTGCKDPFRSVEGKPGWLPERIDQGVDYAATGPIYAVCSGTILNTTNSGWCYVGGCAYISIKIDSGPLKDLVSYMAEGCAPVVHIGQHVTPDTVICNMAAGNANETGWSAPAGTGQPLAQLYGGNGCCSTTAGVSYNRFLKSLGAPSGNLTNNPPIGQPLPSQYP